VVDSKVVNCQLVWRNAERDRAEGGTGILLRIMTEVFVWVYLGIRYDNFMFIEN
jgi:hypothetical protein